MIFFGRNLREYAKIDSTGVLCSDIGDKKYFLKSEHFDFEPIKKGIFLDGGFVFLMKSGELYGKEGKVGLFNGKVKDITVSKTSSHFFLIDDKGDVYSWGWNDYGQLGLGNDDYAISPTLMEKCLFKNEKVLQIKAGIRHSIALTQDGNVYAWGCNHRGRLGLGKNYKTEQQLDKPTLMMKSSFHNKEIIQIATGDAHSLALTKKGDVYAWGSNSNGQLGLGIDDNKTYDKPHFVNSKLFSGERVIKISAGARHSLALTETGKVFTWGDNEKGELGHLNSTKEVTPKDVVFNRRVDDISEDIQQYSVVLAEGKLYKWGSGGKGFPQELNILN